MGQPRLSSPLPSPSGLPLRYTDHAVRDIPWWRSHVERVMDADPNPFPLRMLRLWPRRRRNRGR